ncbi:hypothetical protein X760_32280 [Mesorhizobium sp. LSHC422A00]|nr:hypothetical protein X762_31220 [Mesorhizobium sp. LSHC426A00]ESX47407.1 hypothetical protein X761_30130 [Mesorhizobium sp. LSHC424B00]ESX49728.1 hypothetical protein X760_32280 [Mesorhizobium sp. LSHC422A00]ESX64050.1 hypothetical protein X758_32440 [Mesorhizobium sp. LSHC416B00]
MLARTFTATGDLPVAEQHLRPPATLDEAGLAGDTLFAQGRCSESRSSSADRLSDQAKRRAAQPCPSWIHEPEDIEMIQIRKLQDDQDARA